MEPIEKSPTDILLDLADAWAEFCAGAAVTPIRAVRS
jgi:hypothetical protein